jgi:hypothetical protein
MSVLMFDYARSGYLVAKTTTSPDVVDDDDEHMPEPDVAAEDEAKTDDPRQADGRVHP